MARIDRHVEEMMKRLEGRPLIIDLAATMALEHFTAMMAHEFLARPEHFAGADAQVAALWRWHAIEEIEHKAVAYDTWLHATRGWSRGKRWRVKSFMMLVVTRNFLIHRIRDTLDLLETGRDNRHGCEMAGVRLPVLETRHTSPYLSCLGGLFPPGLPSMECQ